MTPLSATASDYDGADDLAKSLDECYRVIRERMALGQPGWKAVGYSIVTDDDVLQIRATVGSAAEMEIFITALRQRALELPSYIPEEKTNARGNPQPISGDVPSEFTTANIRAIAAAANAPDYITPLDRWPGWPIQNIKGREGDPLGTDHPPAKDRKQEEG